MREFRLVPRPIVNLWKLASEGKIPDSKISSSGRVIDANFVSIDPTISDRVLSMVDADADTDVVQEDDDLVARYENVLRERCKSPLSVAIMPQVDEEGDEFDSSVGDLVPPCQATVVNDLKVRLAIVEREMVGILRALGKIGIVVDRDPYVG